MMVRSEERDRPMAIEGELDASLAGQYWFAAVMNLLAAVVLGLMAHWVWAVVPAGLGLYTGVRGYLASK